MLSMPGGRWPGVPEEGSANPESSAVDAAFETGTADDVLSLLSPSLALAPLLDARLMEAGLVCLVQNGTRTTARYTGKATAATRTNATAPAMVILRFVSLGPTVMDPPASLASLRSMADASPVRERSCDYQRDRLPALPECELRDEARAKWKAACGRIPRPARRHIQSPTFQPELGHPSRARCYLLRSSTTRFRM